MGSPSTPRSSSPRAGRTTRWPAGTRRRAGRRRRSSPSWGSTSPPRPEPGHLDAARILAFVERAWDASVVPTLADYIPIPAKAPACPPPGPAHLAAARILAFVERAWDASVVPTLADYIRIPAKSPAYDREWRAHGHLDRAVALVEGWCRSRTLEGLRVEVHRLEGRTPVIVMEVPGAGGGTVLLYGHVDKQPEMTGWAEGLGAWTPGRRGDRLYGRGGADDGYAAFAALTAIEALEAQGVPHARCVVLIEACEESGSVDLPAHVDALAGRLGTPGLVVCLDSGCGNYEQLWGTTSLRGLVNGELAVEVLTEGIHSGASGIVPSSFRVLRRVLSRLEDEATGAILPRELHAAIPAARLAQARAVAAALGRAGGGRLPPPPRL